jgi:peptidoglycan/xylan/chitin deacetylase (PgdA/CDA1 family)
MKQRIKSALFFSLYYSGIEFLLSKVIRTRAVAILMYHGVCDTPAMPAHLNFHLSRALFERQMRALKHRYAILKLEDVADALKRGDQPKKGVVLTFDDGYRNNFQHVFPALNGLGLPCTIFISTAYVESQQWIPLNQVYWMWSEGKLSEDQTNQLRQRIRSSSVRSRTEILEDLVKPLSVSESAKENFAMLTWDEVQQLSRAGVGIGSHTHSHCNMAVEDESEQRNELQLSKRLLEARLGKSVLLFAYPYGRAEHFSESSRKNIIEAGYECALSTEDGLVTHQSDRFCLPRVGYDTRMWMFMGELLYRFAKQALTELLARRLINIVPDSGRGTLNRG